MLGGGIGALTSEQEQTHQLHFLHAGWGAISLALGYQQRFAHRAADQGMGVEEAYTDVEQRSCLWSGAGV